MKEYKFKSAVTPLPLPKKKKEKKKTKKLFWMTTR